MGASALAGASTAGYATFVERRWIDWNRVDVFLPSRHAALDGLRIALMADLHFDDFGDAGLLSRAVAGINREKVDLVVLAGDFISHRADGARPLTDLLGRLEARLGVFAVWGNHDQWNMSPTLDRSIGDAGVRVLSNERVDCGDFVLAGLESAWGGHPDLVGTLRGVPRDRPVILGWHEPDPFRNRNDDRIALQLSGHTHGGQVCAPGVGPILLPPYGRWFPHGLYRHREQHLFVTRGIGASAVPVRFLCRPEVALLTLRAVRG